ncbi:MAG: hypothetical protein GY822_26010 [Deltaproteobacteria bacterium]|nr:hypothetical protein [Deltaproteobacteria bacterium]
MKTNLALDALPPRTRSWNLAMAASPGALDVVIGAGEISGVVPKTLRGGRMLSNGPGWTRIGERTAHPFDGHGYLRSFEFLDDGSLRLRAEFIATPSYLEEVDAGQLVRRGFATNISPHFWKNLGFGKPRNVANTTVVRWGNRLLAGWEAGNPFAVDPQTLQTRGEESFGGLIEGQATLAHMHLDSANQRLVLCSIKNGRQTQFTFREIDTDDKLVRTSTASVDGMVFAHDYALTPNWFVIGGNPLRVNKGEMAKMLLGRSTLLQSVSPDLDKPGVLHLIPRGGTGEVRTVTLPDGCFVVHFGNAFERDGDVVVDVCAFHTFNLGEEFGYGGPDAAFDPTRPEERGAQRLYRITLKAGETEATWEPLSEHGIDFPRFHPDHEGQQTPAVYGATRQDTRYSDPFDSVIRVDLAGDGRAESLWTAPDNVFVGEPIFVPDSGSDTEGHVLVVLSDGLAGTSTLAIFDALALEDGPIASVPMPLLPIAFHGDWDAGFEPATR